MMLAESNTALERSRSFKEASFDIGDPILIMEYLRKNAYSNPMRAICQEIMSNARDAHREAGIARPIDIILPSRMSPAWSCRDYGLGIDPDRMENVFIKFGKSTKRTDNTQTGGFGIGAKTPWAYSDTFLITTVCNIDGKHIKFNYAAVIGENRVPKLVQMSDPCEVNEETGTTISFNVEAKDQHDFTRYTYEVSQFWNPRPNIKGNENTVCSWNKIEYEFNTDTWAIARNGGTKVLIDGIPYTLNLDSFSDKLTSAEKNLLRYCNCHLIFGVGQLSVSLNREALYYDDRTIKQITNRVKEMISHIRSHYEVALAGSKTLWEAAINYRKAVGFFNHCSDFLKGITWNGKKIPTETIRGQAGIKVIRYKREGKDAYKYAGRIRRFTADCAIDFTENSALIQGDSKSRIEYLFSQTPNLKFVYAFYKEYSGSGFDAKWDAWCKDNEIDGLGAIKVDTLPTPPKVPRAKRERKLIRYKTYEWNGSEFVDTEISADELADGTGIYVPCFRRLAMTDHKCETPIGHGDGFGGWDGLKVSDFTKIFTNSKIKVYGIQKDLLGNLGKGWINLYDYVRMEISNLSAVLNIPIGVVVDVACNGLAFGYNRHKSLGNIIEKNIDKMPKCIVEWYNASKIAQSVADKKVISTQINAQVASFLKLDKIKGYKQIVDHHEEVMNNCKILTKIGFGNYGYEASIEDHVLIYLEALKNKESQAITLVA